MRIKIVKFDKGQTFFIHQAKSRSIARRNSFETIYEKFNNNYWDLKKVVEYDNEKFFVKSNNYQEEKEGMYGVGVC